MPYVMTSVELADRAKAIATKYKTIYILGCFGAPMLPKNVQRYTTNNAFNNGRANLIRNCTQDTFGFDCVGLIKGILWGWNGNKTLTYGGATYKANGVNDFGADRTIKECKNVSSDFGRIKVGEAVWMEGHIGVYIGDGLAVECTPKWANKVQITAVANIGRKSGYNSRTWVKHGELPWVDYGTTSSAVHDDGSSIINKQYIVKNGDTLWGIAKTHLGNGSRYTEIMRLNNLTTTTIRAGQTLKLPNR